MKLADLSPQTIEKIKDYGIDWLYDKHEHWGWEWSVEGGRVEFMAIDGHEVLLPLSPEEHRDVRVVRSIISADRASLIVFLMHTMEKEAYGYMAFCQRVPGEAFFLARIYHSLHHVDDFATS